MLRSKKLVREHGGKVQGRFHGQINFARLRRARPFLRTVFLESFLAFA
jgi:hypothetical protein